VPRSRSEGLRDNVADLKRHWMQDVPDQKQIVAQYCRYTAEIKTGKNVKQMVHRAIQFATSEPQGPVYLMGAREVMEQEIEPYAINPKLWRPIGPSALTGDAVAEISSLLLTADSPLVITGYSGRNHAAVQALVELADGVPNLRILDTGGSDLCFPSSHPAWLSMKYGVDDSVRQADVILVLNCDVPWVNTLCKPQSSCRIVHLDVDPMKQLMPVFYIDAEARYRVDAYTALTQLSSYIKTSANVQKQVNSASRDEQRDARQKSYEDFLARLDAKAASPDAGDRPTAAYVCSTIRKAAPVDTIYAIEAVTNFIIAHEQLRVELPGSWLNCGGGGLGWSGGGALGIKLAADQIAESNKTAKRMVVQIVGDGSYLFSFPSSVYWISQRYGIPVLTIVLNNNGKWKSFQPLSKCTDWQRYLDALYLFAPFE
jgi:thiamine pyrophosphate-dependent acetolactate synthase large subunit-like protein